MSRTSRSDTVTTDAGETFDAYVAIPESGHGPGVMLLQEIFGVNDFLKAKARDLADLGYVVLCPDVFWRVERNVSLPHDEAALAQAFSYAERFFAQDPAQISSDLVAALTRLRALPEVDGKVVVMGYCLGGRLAYEVAVASDPDACVSYYGSGIADRIDVAGDVKCPVIFHFGGSDPFIPSEQVDTIRSAMGDRDNVELHVQEDAGHAFENHLAPQFHHADAAARSCPLTVAFLERELRQ